MTNVPLEKSGMLDKVMNFPVQISEAMTTAKYFDIPYNYDKISNIVVLGMGGSGIVGDFLRVLLSNSPLPVYVNKYMLAPRFVNENTLVLAVTYSGKTSETLNALSLCKRAGAKAVVITSANELESLYNKNKIPCMVIPKNGHSRASLGYMLIPTLFILQKIGVLRGVDEDVLETLHVLKSIKEGCDPSIPVNKNPAHSLALELLGKFPIVYGEYNFTDVAALRWKQMFNENSKTRCYCDVFPELLHNEIEIWNMNGIKENHVLVLLRDTIYEQEIGIQGKIRQLKSMVYRTNSTVFDVRSQGNSELARLLSLSYLGDLTSVYLAMVKGVDPSTVPNIEHMKKFEFEGLIHENI